ncbi:DNA cytosine methyltransferase [Agrobacterium tumefaciens]|nr:DNA cytosine methyltransferase [Agrobacterium tumefaciens]
MHFDRTKNERPGQRPTCIDLFAGAGGFSLGASQAGFKVQLAVEYNPHACATYRRNFCKGLEDDPHLVEGDITDIDPSKLRSELFGETYDCDLMLGGPPCQGFSTHRINNAGVNDPRNKLLAVYFDFVKAFSPKVFLMENVPGMLWPRHSSYVNSFYNAAQSQGYRLRKPVIIDARDFGVWQRRKRVFVLGVRRDLDEDDLEWPPKPTHCDPLAPSDDSSLVPWASCSDVFMPAPLQDENDRHMQHSAALVEVFRRTPHNGGSRSQSGRVLPCHQRHDGHKDVYGRIDPSLPAPTMTTACINPSKGRFVHPTFDHGITARQAARIQTFPDTFVFKGGLMAAGQQIGNAVPVQLAQFLLSHIKQGLNLEKYNSAEKTSITW